MQFLGELDRRFPIARFANDLHVRLIFQHAPKAASDKAVIIHEQDCDLLFHRTPPSLGGPPDGRAFRLRAGAKTQSYRPSTRNAPAWRPARSPVVRVFPRTPPRDPPLPVRAPPAGILNVPKPASLPNAAPHYSAPLAGYGKCALPRRLPPEKACLVFDN